MKMLMNKRAVIALLMAILMLGLVACGPKEEADSKKLVVYSPNSEDIVGNIIPAFEEETGIEVELISAGTGELLKRIDSEKENPYGDLLFGGSKATIRGNRELFDDYISAHDKDMVEGYGNADGFVTPYVADGSVILVNTDLLGELEVKGYADLLKPEFKGQIASADAANSSSAFAQLTNMLMAMGGDYESDAGWDYVGKLLKNIDGKILNSSSAVHKGVADGEYMIGLTYEDPSASYVKDGAPVKIVYPEEGAVFLGAGMAIIKGGPNRSNAEKFVDFVTSKKAQDIFGQELTNRPLRKDVSTGDHMRPLNEIKLLTEDEDYVKNNKEAIIKRYQEVFLESQKD